MSRNKTKIIHNCLQCGNEHFVHICNVKKGYGKYCSSLCSNNSRIGKPPNISIEGKERIRIALIKYRTGRKMSEETKLKVGRKREKHHMWNKHHSKETRVKISVGNSKPKHDEESRKKMSISRMGRPQPKGEKAYAWKGGVSSINARIRISAEYREWRRQVFYRDKFTCQECGVVGSKLQAHHIKSFAKFIESRFDIINGITLCEGCHKKTDNYAGRAKNLII